MGRAVAAVLPRRRAAGRRRTRRARPPTRQSDFSQGALTPARAASHRSFVWSRNQDPRLPFLISGVVLLITTLALSRVESGLVQDQRAPNEPLAPAKPLGQVPMFFIASMVILSLGYQLHFS